MAYIGHSDGTRKIGFDPVDFLKESVDEFLQSGAEPSKIASCIIKIATATELLLKEKLKNLSPSLVLEAIDDDGLQVAKICGLSKKLLNPRVLERITIKTAPFPKLLRRTAHFFDIQGVKDDLAKLYRIRNQLVHHSEEIDLAEVNLLLINKIFPFIEQFTKDERLLTFRLGPETWKQLKALAARSTDIVLTEISKKLAHHARLAEKISDRRKHLLIAGEPEKDVIETITETNLLCPACKKASLSTFSQWDVDYDETGPYGVHFSTMRCRVCGLELDQEEIESIIDTFETFFGEDQQEEKAAWQNSIAEPDNSDML